MNYIKKIRKHGLVNCSLKVFNIIRHIPRRKQAAMKYRHFRSLLGDVGFKYFVDLISHPNQIQAYKSASWFLANVGLTDYAIDFLEKCLAIKFDQEALVFYFQFLLFTSPNLYSHDYIYQAYKKWGATFVSGKRYTNYSNLLNANRRIKIGYTCHFITNSTSSTLLLPLLKAHHRDRVEIFMYSDQNLKDTTDEVRGLVEHWRDTQGMDDDAFCELVRNDQVDILLELNGHIIINRYRALSRKPAPIQVNYYNHLATCGVPGIDYLLLGEEDLEVDYLQPYFSEKFFHKKGVQLATCVSSHFPDVTPSPFINNGYVTFASFGQSHKVSLESIRLWSEILKRVPNSKLYFKTNVLDFPAYKSVYEKHFADCGVDITRIIFEGPTDYKSLLSRYALVDITLDTFPYGAGTTTMESSIMGVPVVALINMKDRLTSKNAYRSLHYIGHDELLSYSKDEYIAKAVNLANDRERLIQYRQGLREDVRRSRRGNMEQFITELEDAYLAMWEIYLQEQTSAVKDIVANYS